MKSDDSSCTPKHGIIAKATSLISSMSKRQQPQPKASEELQLISLTNKFRNIPEIVNRGRKREIQDVFSILQKMVQHNVLLYGPFGVGEGAIVEAVAEQIAKGTCPDDFKDVDIVEFSLDEINPSLYSEDVIDMKLAAMAEYFQAHPKNILYIQDFGRIVEYGLYEQIKLFARNFRFITTVDSQKYDTDFYEKDHFIVTYFEVLSIISPEYEEVYDILEYRIKCLEQYHQVEITREDVELIMDIAFRNEGEFLPWSILNSIDFAMGVCKSHGTKKVDVRAIFEQSKYYIGDFFKMPPEKIKVIAYHEAGHCIVGRALGIKFHGIQIIPSSDTLGSNYFDPDRNGVTSREELICHICMALAGVLATDMKGFPRIDGASSDLSRASNMARNMVANYCMEDEDLISYVEGGQIKIQYMSEKAKDTLDSKTRDILKEAIKKTKKILEDNSENLELLVRALLKKGFLTTKEVHDLLDNSEGGRKLTVDSLPDIHDMLFT